jgi:NitT/TauT family transport system substrate-binding protein
MIRASLVGAILTGILVAIGASAAVAEPVVVKVGAASTTSDAPIYIADKKGYFSDEGLAVTVINFRSAADMVAPLGTGELDAGRGFGIGRSL